MGLFDFFSGKPSHDKFARIIIDALRKDDFEGSVEYDARSFSLKVGESVLHLGNAYADYCKAPRAARPQVIAAYLPVASDHPVISDNLDEAKPHLMPCASPCTTRS